MCRTPLSVHVQEVILWPLPLRELQPEMPCPERQNSTLTCMLGGVVMQHSGVDVPLLMQEAPGSPEQATLVLISKHLCTGTSTGQHHGCEGGPAREEGASM